MNTEALILALEPFVEMINVIELDIQDQKIHSSTLEIDEEENLSLITHGLDNHSVQITANLLRGARFIHRELLSQGDAIFGTYILYKLNPLVAIIDAIESEENANEQFSQSVSDDYVHLDTAFKSKIAGRDRVNLQTGDLRKLRMALAA